MTRRPRVAYPGPIVDVVLVRRDNRYRALVRPVAGGRAFAVHVANPGRMEELLLPGGTLGRAVPAYRPGRKTTHDLVSVRHGRTWVSIDSRIGNRLVRQAIGTAWLPGTEGGAWRAEVRWGASRLDFGRDDPRAPGRPRDLLEVKCSNLAVGTTAMFPDAPTVRGTRHVRELTRAARRGIRATVLFVVQRSGMQRFRPNAVLDPAFAAALRRAARAGVAVRAVTTRVRRDRIEWGAPIPVELGGSRPTSTGGRPGGARG